MSAAPRRPYGLSAGPATKAIARLKPAMWWRMNEFTGPLAKDESGHHRHAAYEGGVAYYLDGPHSAKFCAGEVNRAPHFVSGRLSSEMSGIGAAHSVSLWLWNGMPTGARDITGWFYSRDHQHGVSAYGEHLGLNREGRLLFEAETPLTGTTEIPRWTWQHVVLVRDGDKVLVYLNGKLEIEGSASASQIPSIFFGSRSDDDSSWEGRLDEIAIFDRPLTPAEVQQLQP